MRRNFSSADASRSKTRLLALLMGRVGIILVILFACLFWVNVRSVSAPGAEKPLSPPILVSAADCEDPVLLLGSNPFPIKRIQRGADGSLAVPSDTTGIAYWVKGTEPSFLFLLSPMPGNMIAMSTLTTGSTATLTWSNCNSTTYRLSAPQQGSLSGSAWLDQLGEGITIFFETDVSGVGFVFRGKPIDE